ncbi:PREDICTED: neutrophil gelatinase-associated lipocalin-like [Chinchilla lanigera]|uniref:Neutrophil gelatinase-associated lipocalin-like n=1 Tax=Chinchilla lanigera TaxID=34839 RepID=A0A8C2ULJ3_CHILA|nr:PREDICTED: neutrophil gelatinase-associated lipocalin-like [Chinchilla lanigera]
MALGLLCLGLTLMGTLKIQIQDFNLAVIPSPPLSKIPLQPDFQEKQFQGKWYTIGWAQNTNWNHRLSQLLKFSSNYKLKDDHSYNVSSTWFSNHVCDHRSDTILPSGQPGQFTLDNLPSYNGLQNYTMRVVSTDYNQFAMVFYKLVFNNIECFELMLYGRTMGLSPEQEDLFFNFAKSLGLPDDYISFIEPMENCMD